MNTTSATSQVRPHSLHRLRTYVGIWLPFLFLATFFFGKAFTHQEQFLFRDAAHFYYPLFHEVTRQWKTGEVPLWSPFDGIGMPLAADATPSVFYPGKLVLLTPLGFGFGMRLYVVMHFAIAYGGMLWAARTWGCSVWSAALAAIAYAFGGPVLSYHANVIFLVGASWLPFALANGWLLARRPALLPGIGLAFSLSMMILGGDPQLAFHAMMMLTVAAVVFVLPWRRFPSWRIWLQWRAFRIGSLVAVSLLAACLSAVQILPTSEWTSRSLRATTVSPRNIYEVAEGIGTDEEDRWDAVLGNPKPNTHALHSYDFSIGPWNWPNIFIANFTGKMYPRNDRWVRTIPAEGRIWFASIFMGSLAIFLAGYAIWNRRLRRVDRWLVAIGLFGLIASLGWYGLGWIILEVGYGLGWDGENLPIGSPFGGLYWLLNMIVPKYAQFRYPAKWWIFLAFAVPILAARGLDQLRPGKRLLRFTIALASILLLVGVALLPCASWVGSLLPAVQEDTLFGPLDAAGGISQMAVGVLSAGVVIAAGFLALHQLPRRLAFTFLLIIAAGEVAIGNSWVAPTASQELWNPSGFDHTNVPFRLSQLRYPRYFDRSENHYPQSFATTSSEDRLIEGLKIDREQLFPRYHLLDPVRGVPSVVSIRPRDYEAVWHTGQDDLLKKMHGLLRSNPDAWTEAWWQSSVQWHEEVDSTDPGALWQASEEIMDWIAANDSKRNYQVVAPHTWPEPQAFAWDSTNSFPVMLEAEHQDQPRLLPAAPGAKVETKYVRERAGQIEVQLKSCQPGWIILREYFDPGWQCTITDAKGSKRTDVPVFRANRILMAVPVQAGDTEVTLTYWPRSFVIGAVISVISWLALLVLFAARVSLAAFGRGHQI